MNTPMTDHFRLAQEMRKAVFMLGYAVTNMENGQVDAEHRRTIAVELMELAQRLEPEPVVIAGTHDHSEVPR